jgi:hypothetical protein
VTGNPQRASYQAMELIEYDLALNDFTFQLIRFPSGFAGVGTTMPQPSSTECRECHGDKPRPLWGAYPLWPGAYGAAHDTLTKTETENLKSFANSLALPEKARYRKFTPQGENFLGENSNIRLGIHLNYLNLHRMHAEMAATPFLTTYRFALFGALAGCSDMPNFFPEEIAAAHANRLGFGPEALLELTRRSQHREAQSRTRLHLLLHPNETLSATAEDTGMFERNRSPSTSNLRYVVEGQSIDPTLDMKHWALSYAPGRSSYSFSNGGYGIQDLLLREIRPLLLPEQPWLKEISYSSGNPDKEECDRLASLSRKNFTDQKLVGPPPPPGG